MGNFRTTGAVRMLLLLPASAAWTFAHGQSVPTANASAQWVSQYVWRGIQVYDNPGVQPSIELTFDSLTLGWWAHLDWPNGEDMVVKEHDIYASYAMESNGWSVSPYWIQYHFPNETFISTSEVGATLGRSFGDLDFSLDVAFDTRTVKGGMFAQASLAKSWENSGTSNTATLAAGYWNAKSNNAAYGINKASINYFSFDYTISREIGKGVTGYIGGTALFYPTSGIDAGGNEFTGVFTIGASKSF